MKKIIIGLLISFAILSESNAQQDAEYSMYMFNGMYVNPAYAGSKEFLSTSAIYRHQWADMPGAPRSISVGLHSAFKRDQYAAGLLLTNDRIGVTNTYAITGAYAYRLKFEKSTLALGVQGSISYYNTNFQELQLIHDIAGDALFAVNESLLLPNIGFGIYHYGKKYYIGFAVPHLVNNKLNNKMKVEATEQVAKQYNHYVASAGYVFGKDIAKVKFKPSVLLKYVQGVPIEFDLNSSFLIADRYWIGASYTTGGDIENSPGESITAIVEFKATQQLRMGYAYDYALSKIGSYSNGTHEIMVGYDFSFEKQRFVNPRYLHYF